MTTEQTPAPGPEVEAALAWVEADPLDNTASVAGARAMHALPGVLAFWPCNSAPPHILDNVACHFLAAEVRRLRGEISVFETHIKEDRLIDNLCGDATNKELTALREQLKLADGLAEALEEADDVIHALANMYPATVHQAYGDAEHRTDAALAAWKAGKEET